MRASSFKDNIFYVKNFNQQIHTIVSDLKILYVSIILRANEVFLYI